jgi:hypothetical protein
MTMTDKEKEREMTNEDEDEARRAWEKYCQSGKKPVDIPERPDLVYAKEWKGWVDWLGWHNIDH